ncbi:MAG: SH3 domain-containing protein [Clostridia bacterium]|nr:SH3 domain-containing protein [Clostridia bacterium]
MKKLAAILLTACILLCFAACGKTGDNDRGNKAQSSENDPGQITDAVSGYPAEQTVGQTNVQAVGETATVVPAAEERKTDEGATARKEEENTTAASSGAGAETTAADAGDTASLGKYTVTASAKNIIMYQDDSASRILATIPYGKVITVTEISNGFARTSYKDNTGWVSMEDITYTPDAADQTEPSGDYDNYNEYPAGTYEVVDAPSVNIRSAPDTSDEENIVGKVYRGEQYELSVFDGEWAKITLEDRTQGWVYMGYMEFVGWHTEE